MPRASGLAETDTLTQPLDFARILVVDDDPLLLETLAINLQDNGLSVTTVESGESALRLLDEDAGFDLAILDWKMPGLSGLDTLKEINARGVELPALFLTSLTDQIFEESALASGAIDFVDKSRSFSILMRRIEIILLGLRQGKARNGTISGESADRQNEETAIGALGLDQIAGRAFWNGQRVPLTLTEFHIVEHLARNAGRDVKYREIYNLVHGEDFYIGASEDGYRGNVRSFVKRIRQKFKELDPGFDQIENYPGFGYRWRETGRAAG